MPDNDWAKNRNVWETGPQTTEQPTLRHFWQSFEANLKPGQREVDNNNNNVINNNNYDNVYDAIILTKVIARVHPVHLMNIDWPRGVAANTQTKAIDLGCESDENWQLPSTSTIAIVIITQPVSWNSVCCFAWHRTTSLPQKTAGVCRWKIIMRKASFKGRHTFATMTSHELNWSKKMNSSFEHLQGNGSVYITRLKFTNSRVNWFIGIHVCYSAPDKGVEYCDDSSCVFVCVCLSVRNHMCGRLIRLMSAFERTLK